MISFDPSISAGTALTLLALVFQAGGVWMLVRRLQSDMVDLKIDIRKLNEVTVATAVQDARLTSHANRLDAQDKRLNAMWDEWNDLRHGRGWVQSDIDGEYARTGKLQGLPPANSASRSA